MCNDRQNVGEHDQEAGNVYLMHPSSVCRLSSVFRLPPSAFRLLRSVACQGVALSPSRSAMAEHGGRSLVRRPSSATSAAKWPPRLGRGELACHAVRVAPQRGDVVVCRPSSGFTLVELMVVVAIISILVMLLVPNIRAMREKALSSNCRNNLRQYGVAMNQYMADFSGYFIYPGLGVGGARDGSALPGQNLGDFQGLYDGRAVAGATVGGKVADSFGNFVRTYVGANVTLASLSAGEPAVQVCPVVLRELHTANYFDTNSPKFKGYRRTIDITGLIMDTGDFANYSISTYLDSSFTTYAINFVKVGQNKSAIPQNVVAFIDWNARDGWGAWLGFTNWAFSGTNSQGVAVVQDTATPPKRTDGAWWLTEVGFHHLGSSNEYGANYVAMDGHVGWVGSNTISITNFTTGL